MKKLLCFLLPVFISFSVFSQSDSVKTHYVFPDFVQGTVKLKVRNEYQVPLNYNTVLEQMIYIENDQKLAIGNPQHVDYILLENRKFIPVGKVFYEEVASGKNPAYVQYTSNVIPPGKPAGYGGTSETSAIRQSSSINISGQFVQLNLPEGYKLKSEHHFWINKDNTFHRTNTVKQFMKLFPEKAGEIKSFVKANKIKLKTVEEFKLLHDSFID